MTQAATFDLRAEYEASGVGEVVAGLEAGAEATGAAGLRTVAAVRAATTAGVQPAAARRCWVAGGCGRAESAAGPEAGSRASGP